MREVISHYSPVLKVRLHSTHHQAKSGWIRGPTSQFICILAQ